MDERLDEIVQLLTAVARLDFSKRVQVLGDGSPLDAMAAAGNMLAEEIEFTQENLKTKNKRLVEATEAKSRFLASVSHELRTPLAALLGFTELILDTSVDDQQRYEYARIVRRNGEQLLSLIDDIIDVSRIESGKMSVFVEPVDMGAFLTEIVSVMRARALEQGLDFELTLSSSIPREVLTDLTRLRQILLNLVGNAIKFTPTGSVEVDVSYKDTMMCFLVRDTGIGMTDDQLKIVFDVFQQGDDSMNRRYGGAGLGLAICRVLVNALGGTVSAESEPGKGTTFSVRLPIEMAQGASRFTSLSGVKTDPPMQQTAPVRLSGDILIAEDGRDNRVLIMTILRKYGFSVTTVGDGRAAAELAIERLKEGSPFDVILMDMQMPVLDGYGATTLLREQGYTRPIIALTAHAMSEERQRCLDSGCDDYLAKPVSKADLIRVITSYIDGEEAEGRPPSSPPMLLSTYRDDPDMRDVIAAFVAVLPERIEEIRVAAAGPDTKRFRRLLHQLEGAGGGYGFMPLTLAARRVRVAVKAGADPMKVIAELTELATQIRYSGENK